MKAEYRTIFGMCLLLLLGLATIAGACPPGGCPTCWHWDAGQGKCVMNGNCDDNSDCCCGCGSCVNCNCASCTLPCCEGDCWWCWELVNCNCICSQPVISCFYEDCCVQVGQNYQFSVTGPHINCVNYCLIWSAPDGDPEIQYGGQYFSTHWDTPGVYTVYVHTYCGSYDSKTVTVCDTDESCCDGNCYNQVTQKCCSDANTSYPCDSNQTCCQGICCDPNKVCCKPSDINQKGTCCDPNTEFCCDGKCCKNWQCCIGGNCVDPMCDGCHQVLFFVYECFHGPNDTECWKEACIENVFYSSSCNFKGINWPCKKSHCDTGLVEGYSFTQIIRATTDCPKGGQAVEIEPIWIGFWGCDECNLQDNWAACIINPVDCEGEILVTLFKGDKFWCGCD